MDNLARELVQENVQEKKIIDNPSRIDFEINRNKKIVRHRYNKKVIVEISIYATIFLLSSCILISAVAKEAKANMKIHKLRSQVNTLEKRVGLLKSEYNLMLNLDIIEKYAKENLDMNVTDKIYYMKIKN